MRYTVAKQSQRSVPCTFWAENWSALTPTLKKAARAWAEGHRGRDLLFQGY